VGEHVQRGSGAERGGCTSVLGATERGLRTGEGGTRFRTKGGGRGSMGARAEGLREFWGKGGGGWRSVRF